MWLIYSKGIYVLSVDPSLLRKLSSMAVDKELNKLYRSSEKEATVD